MLDKLSTKNKKSLNATNISVSLDNVSIKYGNSLAVKNIFCEKIYEMDYL